MTKKRRNGRQNTSTPRLLGQDHAPSLIQIIQDHGPDQGRGLLPTVDRIINHAHAVATDAPIPGHHIAAADHAQEGAIDARIPGPHIVAIARDHAQEIGMDTVTDTGNGLTQGVHDVGIATGVIEAHRHCQTEDAMLEIGKILRKIDVLEYLG